MVSFAFRSDSWLEATSCEDNTSTQPCLGFLAAGGGDNPYNANTSAYDLALTWDEARDPSQGSTTAIEDVDALVLRVDPAIEGVRVALGSEGSCNLSVPNIAFTTWRTGSDNFTPVLEFTPFCRQ